jgi:anti-anti-sigma factor
MGLERPLQSVPDDLSAVNTEPWIETAEIVIRFEGELDIDTEGRFRATLDRCLERLPQHLILDMSDLIFMGVEGIHLVLSLAERCARDDAGLLVFLNRRQSRLFHLAGADDRFEWRIA